MLFQSAIKTKFLISRTPFISCGMHSFVNTVPATLGEKLSSVDTPSLIVNKKILHRNLQKMKDFVNTHNNTNTNRKITYRPHTKTHKCPALAKLQIEEYGATGVCVQILDEAEAMINAGVLDVFISNQCIGSKKIARLCELSKRGQISIIVDDLDNIKQIAAAATSSGATIDVLIEINAGQNRCGVDVLEDKGLLCVQLAQAIEEFPHLHFKGIHCYHGAIQHTRSVTERQQQVLAMPVTRASIAVQALEAAGVAVNVVTGGGTGTFPFESASGRYTEIQPGSYCFMDVDYGENEDGKSIFENALFLHTMVVSKSSTNTESTDTNSTGVGSGTRVVLDAGTKASSYDSGMPVPLRGWVDGSPSQRLRGVELQNGGDEHSVLVGGDAITNTLKVGDTLRLLPGHVDPTVNMHQFLVVVDDEDNGEEAAGKEKKEPVVVDIWSISGRSPGF